MHYELLKEASLENLKLFNTCMFNKLKDTDVELYEELELELYSIVDGEHFNRTLLDKAVSSMKNEDGTSGAKWTLEQTNGLLKQHNVVLTNFNEYDFNYVMNMLYSDYYGSVPNETSIYFNMAMKFLNDKDACEGKAFKYYQTMQ